MVVVRFKRAVFSEQYDACAPGDILRCDEAFARHVVHNLAAAEYVQAPVPAAVKRARKAPVPA